MDDLFGEKPAREITITVRNSLYRHHEKPPPFLWAHCRFNSLAGAGYRWRAPQEKG
jgi:hypothetical protein